MVPARHGETAWKRWIFCPTDHLDFENLENRRRYHNPGKPRTAGLCGREVVASDHLPLSSTFFGRPKSPDLPPKPAAAVPLPRLFFLWRYPRKTTSPASVHTGRTWPATSPDAVPSTKSSHSSSQVAAIGQLSIFQTALISFQTRPKAFVKKIFWERYARCFDFPIQKRVRSVYGIF